MSYATQEEVEYMASIGWHQACADVFFCGWRHMITRREDCWEACGSTYETGDLAAMRVARELYREAEALSAKAEKLMAGCAKIEEAIGEAEFLGGEQ
jgi:hypothetical protein